MCGHEKDWARKTVGLHPENEKYSGRATTHHSIPDCDRIQVNISERGQPQNWEGYGGSAHSINEIQETKARAIVSFRLGLLVVCFLTEKSG